MDQATRRGAENSSGQKVLHSWAKLDRQPQGEAGKKGRLANPCRRLGQFKPREPGSPLTFLPGTLRGPRGQKEHPAGEKKQDDPGQRSHGRRSSAQPQPSTSLPGGSGHIEGCRHRPLAHHQATSAPRLLALAHPLLSSAQPRRRQQRHQQAACWKARGVQGGKSA